jgi:hypothetical protein
MVGGKRREGRALNVDRKLPPELPPNTLAQGEMGQHSREPKIAEKPKKIRQAGTRKYKQIPNKALCSSNDTYG